MKDFVHTGDGSRTLGVLVDLILASDAQPLFPSVLEEPYLFRRIKKWIRDGLEERRLLEEAKKGMAP